MSKIRQNVLVNQSMVNSKIIITNKVLKNKNDKLSVERKNNNVIQRILEEEKTNHNVN